ncbi:MAG TPA: glycosyltransferase 87 family protein [Propionicimonas sp.]
MSGVARMRRSFLPWLIAGAIAWFGVVFIGWGLWNQDPPRAGFDLALLLDGARALAAGQSPYDPAMLAGGSPSATELFYSYPPPVAQAMQLVAWLPDGVVLVVWGVGATLGLGHIGGEIARRHRDGEPRSTIIGAKAMLDAPLFLPVAIAVLFGNLDAWYPLAYGALLLAAFPTSGPGTFLAAGVAVAVVAVAKLHPGTLVLWLLARVLVERGGPWRTVLAACVVAGLAIVGVSVLLGGVQLWLDYLAVIRAGAGAELVDPRNLGPVSLLGQATGIEGDTLKGAQAVVALAAAALTVVAAVRVKDPIASLAVAFAASLVVLPVTWYHYPVALVPIGLALAITRPASRPWVAAAMAVAGVAIAIGPLLWVAVAIIVVAAFRVPEPERGPGSTTRDAPVVPVTGRTTSP